MSNLEKYHRQFSYSLKMEKNACKATENSKVEVYEYQKSS